MEPEWVEEEDEMEEQHMVTQVVVLSQIQGTHQQEEPVVEGLVRTSFPPCFLFHSSILIHIRVTQGYTLTVQFVSSIFHTPLVFL